MYCMYVLYVLYVLYVHTYVLYVLYVLYSSPQGTYPTVGWTTNHATLFQQICYLVYYSTISCAHVLYILMLYNVFFCVTYCTYMQKDCMYVRTYVLYVLYVCFCMWRPLALCVHFSQMYVGTYVCIAVPLLPNWRTVTCQYYCWHCTSLSLCVTVNLCSGFRVPSAPLAHLVHLVQSAGL